MSFERREWLGQGEQIQSPDRSCYCSPADQFANAKVGKTKLRHY